MPNALTDENQCTARTKNCRKCAHRYVKGDKGWNCPQCGAERRCERYKVTGISTCQMHGGGSPKKGRPGGRPPMDGSIRRSMLPQRMWSTFDAAMEDRHLLILRQDLAQVETRMEDLLKIAETPECGFVWKALATAVNNYQRAVARQERGVIELELNKVFDLVEKGNVHHSANEEIERLISQRIRLVESERRRMLDTHQMISVERVLGLMEKVANVIDGIVDEREKKMAIAYGLKDLLTQGEIIEAEAVEKVSVEAEFTEQKVLAYSRPEAELVENK